MNNLIPRIAENRNFRNSPFSTRNSLFEWKIVEDRLFLDTYQISMSSSTVIVTHPSYYLKTSIESLLFGNRCSDQNLTSRRQKRSLARVLESRDNAWEDDEDVPFHRTSDRACWPMINRDNVRDRYRISIKVSALVRFSSMLRLTDRTRKKNQSFSKINSHFSYNIIVYIIVFHRAKKN